MQTFFKKSYFLLYDYVFLSFIHKLEAISDSQVLEFFEKSDFFPKNF